MKTTGIKMINIKNGRLNLAGNKGFSIMEILVAIIIFAVGMMALASLQGSLTRSSANASVRTVATNIAEETIESLRGFAHLETDPAGILPAYEDIVSTSPTTVARGGINYTVTTTVTDMYYHIASDSFMNAATYFAPNPPPTDAFSDYKVVSVNVTWDDTRPWLIDESTSFTTATGITLAAAISSVTTGGSSKVTAQLEVEPFVPWVDYSPGSNPDIVSLSLGNNRFKESLTPEPKVIRRNELVDTRFDVITYSQIDGAALFVRREEFSTVACDCTLKIASGTAESSGRRPVVWAGDEYAVGHWVDKPYGVSSNSSQSPLCSTCCRDHHDGGSSADDHSDTAVNKYYPFRVAADYHTSGSFNGDHKHYTRNNNGSLSLAATNDAPYVEACRLVRVDGFFRVAQDFRQEDLNVFPEDFLDEDSEVATYSGYVTVAADDFENAATGDYEASPPCIGGPSPCVEEPPLADPWPTPLAADKFPVWTQLPLPPDGAGTQQARSRGIYIDYLSSDLRSVVDCLRGGGTAGTASTDCHTGDVVLDKSGSSNVLELIPFFDVQLTFLNRWNELPVNTPVDSTNEPVLDDNAHSRGVLSKNALGGSTVSAKGNKNNIGFIDTLPIDGTFAANIAVANIDVQALNTDGTGGSVPTPGSDPVVTGIITDTVPGAAASDVQVRGLNGVRCDRTPEGFYCVIPVGSVNPRVEIYGYGRASGNQYACLTGNTLGLYSLKSSSNDANAVYNLYKSSDPQPSGSGYNINVQNTECPIGGIGG